MDYIHVPLQKTEYVILNNSPTNIVTAMGIALPERSMLNTFKPVD